MYLGLLQDHLPTIAAQILELMMNARRKRAESVERLLEEFSKMVGREEGKIEGKLEGKLEGRLEGKLEGEAEGARRARREDVSRLLRRLRRDAEIEGLSALELPALDVLFEQLLDELQAPA